MKLLKLTERAALVLKSCERLQSEPESEAHGRALAEALDALAKTPPDEPPILVGLFNQTVALGDNTIFRIVHARRSPTPEAIDSVRRAVARLRECATDLHAAAARRPAIAGRPVSPSPSFPLSLPRKA